MNEITPVMIVTLCRYRHLVRCINSLKANELAKETELYIGLDYPLKEEHWEGYREICTYLEGGIDGFKEVHIIRQDRNIGSVKNYRIVRAEIYKKYDSYIYMEDDNEVSSNYLAYMNQSMNYFRDDSKVLAVSGYMYPIDTSGTEGNVLFLNTHFSCFGYGVFRRTDELFEHNITMSSFSRMYRDRKMMERLRRISADQYGYFVKGMLQYTGDELVCDGEVRKIDLTYGLYMFFNDYKMVFPIISKVRNHGFDGTGEHCGIQRQRGKDNSREYDFSQQEIDSEEKFELNYIKSDTDTIDWNERLSRFFVIPKKEMYRTMAAYYLSLILGRNIITKLVAKMRK